MKHTLAAVCLIMALSLLVIGTKWQGTNVTATPMKKTQQSPSQEIEAKAKRAQNGDENSIRELTDSIFESYLAALPDAIRQHVKERLIRAEVKHRQGKKGIKETNIVKAMNQLADVFGAPEYAKSSPLQVRVLRAKLKEELPSLISPEDESQHGLKKRVGHDLKADVSPLEAITILTMLIQQKMLNPDWQLTPREYAESIRKKPYRPTVIGDAGQREARIVLDKRDRQKSQDMMLLVGRKVTRLSPTSVSELVESSLDALGIER